MFLKLFQFQSVYKACYKTIGKGVNCCGNPGNHEFAHTPQIFLIMPEVTLFFFQFLFLVCILVYLKMIDVTLTKESFCMLYQNSGKLYMHL